MSTCKDCIHGKRCLAPHGFLANNMPYCFDFFDKSLCIKLPYKVGQEVWTAKIFKDGIVRKGEITVFFVGENGVYSCMVSFTGEAYGAEFLISEFGKTVFLTRQEAERALKEREKNVSKKVRQSSKARKGNKKT